MTKVVVTGGSGKAGTAVVRDLVEHGYEALNVDVLPPRENLSPYLKVELTELGQVFEALHGADCVVHLGGIPSSDIVPEEPTFRNNTLSTYNVFEAAKTLGLKRVVWASSGTALGVPFNREKPAYAPIDEEHPLYPESSYALSKVVSEEMARQFSRWSGVPFVGLRFSYITDPEEYQRFPDFQQDPKQRRWSLWSYVDVRDVAQSCRLGLEADVKRAEVFIIAAADTVMDRPSRELMSEVFPGVPVRDGLGEHDTLLSIDKARKMLGYAPAYSWREEVQHTSSTPTLEGNA